MTAFLESNYGYTLFHPLTQLFARLGSFLGQAFLHVTQPSRYSIVLSTAADLTRSRADLIAENALLRQQLIVLHRQVRKPSFSQPDRLWLVLLSRRVNNWKESLPIFQPDTLLCWHRQGFRPSGSSDRATAVAAPNYPRRPWP